MKLFIALMLFALPSCGYHVGTSELNSRYRTISVPYAEGDFDGSFTTEMIHQVATSSSFQYKRNHADLILKIFLSDFDTENIGYRYYINKQDKRTRETIPVETRLFITATVSLLDANSGYELLSPVRISANSDFDHDFYSTKDKINVFSLGQLTDYDEAFDAARKPLFFNLARKINDYLNDSW